MSGGGHALEAPRAHSTGHVFTGSLAGFAFIVAVFGLTAIVTTSLVWRMVFGVLVPVAFAVTVSAVAIVKRERPRGLGILIGTAVGALIAMFCWWVMLISSGIS